METKKHTKASSINSDESHGTEIDESLSISGTVSEVDDPHDNLSVVSETASLSSKGFKSSDVKKLTLLLNKLKRENLMLKDSLEKANLNDVVMLKTKLRGAKADLMQYKQYNQELKDRVQILERKVHEALNHQILAAKDLKQSSGKPSDASNGLIADLQTRYSHLSKLVKSYEKKIIMMQSELDSFKNKEKDENKINRKSVIIDTTENKILNDTEKHSYNDINHINTNKSILTKNISGVDDIPKTQREIFQKELLKSVQKAREQDDKTIKELASEVKRLVSLLPRSLIEQDSVVGNSDNPVPSEDPIIKQSFSNDEGRLENSEVLSEIEEQDLGLIEEKVVKRREIRFSVGSLLLSFVAGAGIMLVCFLITFLKLS